MRDFLVVGQARWHRPAGHEDRRQMTEGERADEQARHDLVADAEAEGRVEHVVGQRDRRRQRDHVAAEQRQLHARLALGDAIAHGGHAAGELRHGADLARRLLDDRREIAVGLMRRQHVVVGGDDADVGRAAVASQVLLVGAAQAAKPWARLPQDSCVRCGFARAPPRDALQVVARGVAAGRFDALGDVGDGGLDGS